MTLPGISLFLTQLCLLAAGANPAPDAAALVRTVDERMRHSGDLTLLSYLRRWSPEATSPVMEAVVYRRDTDQALVILLTKPKTEEGRGYLRLGQNTFEYLPTIGRWERRTVSERIAGTDARREDFDMARYSEHYDATYEDGEKLQSVDTHRIRLRAKGGALVAFPVILLWVDKESGNLLRRKDFAESGKLIRTVYLTSWMKLQSESKKSEVWIPGQVTYYDELAKGSGSTLKFIKASLKPIAPNVFTKAWVESKSR
jgi:hypothetical protein